MDNLLDKISYISKSEHFQRAVKSPEVSLNYSSPLSVVLDAQHQTPHSLFQKLERVLANLMLDILAKKNWNEIEEQLKTLSFRCFKQELKERFLDKYRTIYTYIHNNIWGRLNFLFTTLLFFSLRGFFSLFSIYNSRDFSFFFFNFHPLS